MPKPQWVALANVGHLHQVRDVLDQRQLLILSARLQCTLELSVAVEVVFNRGLAASGDDDDVVDARIERFLDAVLDERLVDQREGLFRLSFGGRKEASTHTGGGKDGFAYLALHRYS